MIISVCVIENVSSIVCKYDTKMGVLMQGNMRPTSVQAPYRLTCQEREFDTCHVKNNREFIILRNFYMYRSLCL